MATSAARGGESCRRPPEWSAIGRRWVVGVNVPGSVRAEHSMSDPREATPAGRRAGARLVSRPAFEGDGRLPVDRLEPAQRGDEAAGRVIATIFLPLARLTGFFGQNFGWLVRSIRGWEGFVGLGVGTELLALAILLAFFKRRGWF
jgi:hypothetical protein